MKSIRRSLILCIAMSLVLFTARRALALDVNGGDVPLPVMSVMGGPLQSAWNGPYSDLLAADALAECWTTQQDRGYLYSSGIEPDQYLASLLAEITAATSQTTVNAGCHMSGFTSQWEDLALCEWMQQRVDPTQNVDASTGEPRALDTSSLRTSAQFTPEIIPSPSTLGLSGSAATILRSQAQQEVSYADLSLCMAEQLNEKLDTVQVAFASNDDLERVQDAVRERALTAVYEYSVVSKAFATSQPAPTVVNGSFYYLAPLALWINSPSFTAATQFGDDFAEAIRLLIDATDNLIQIDLRDPTVQHAFGTPGYDTSGNFTGLTGPRVDVLEKVLYDGFVQNAPYLSTISQRSVLTDMSAPTVAVMLGLARQANALSLSLRSGTIGFTQRVANANAMYQAVESYVRNADCQNRGIPSSSCPPAPTVGAVAVTNFMIWQRYRVTPNDAQAVVDALTEVVFGPPEQATRGSIRWNYNQPFFYLPNPENGPTGLAQQLTFHLFGKQSFSGMGSTTITSSSLFGSIVIDPNFSVAPLRAHDIQSMRGPLSQLPVRDLNPAGAARPQIGNFRSNPIRGIGFGGLPSDRRQLGSNTVLAIAREALDQLAVATNASKAIYTEAAPALPLIQQAIGPRQVLVRQAYTPLSDSGSCSTCVEYNFASTSSGSATTYTVNVDVLTQGNDPMTSAAIVPGIPLAATIVKDPNTVTVWGTSQSNLASLTYTTMTTKPMAGGDQLLSMTGNWSTSSPQGMTVLLEGPNSSGSGSQYEHVFTGVPDPNWVSYAGIGAVGTVVTFGGRFGREVEDAWKFDPNQWGVPRYDGFGLPLDWTPAADASLLGDSQGTSVEQHFIDRATTAATDSATALQQAFDNLQQDETDTASLTASEMQSQQLDTLNYTSLCGAAAGAACAPTYTYFNPTIPACAAPDPAACESFRTDLGSIVAASGTGALGVPIAAAVSTEIASSDPSPTFGTYGGGTLQGLFLNQWNAVNALNASLTSAVATVGSGIAQVTAAGADVTAAQSDTRTAQAQVAAAFTNLIAQGVNYQTQQTAYTAQQSAYNASLTAATQTLNNECDNAAFASAYYSGFTFSGENGLNVDVNGQLGNDAYWDFKTNNYYVGGQSGKSWSRGPLYDQIDRCNQAQSAWNVASAQATAQTDQIHAQLVALQTQIVASGLMIPLDIDAYSAAQAHLEAATARQAAAAAAEEAQVASSLQSVQVAFGQLLATVTAIDQAYTQSDVAAAKIALDQQQMNYDIRTRFGLRQRYQSYDLWRARALTENARRLAVAARRAIESRYVVDLSALNAPEPFVDSPSLWADDIYSSDLKPPFAVGLTTSPTSATGIYPNTVSDYVNNLQLFLDGYSVQRPTAAVQSDAEVIQLPAPASAISASAYNASIAYIDPTSSGWSFYCPNTSTWVSNPDFGTFTRSAPSWTLPTVCGGQPPTMARLGFGLDPWGGLEGSISDPPNSLHYNVRFGELAVNLVGSGIRNCQNAADPSTCYAEPFIRYDLEQDGPMWVTDYNQEWKSLDIPPGTIQGAKALATEEWLDPVSNGFNRSDVTNVARTELVDRPISGTYTLTLYLTPDVAVEQIERIQLLTQTSYWVRQQ